MSRALILSFIFLSIFRAFPISASPVSLFLPLKLAPGVPMSATIIGTDGSGHTTWVLKEGAASGTFTKTGVAESALATAPVTLVEGSTDAHMFGAFGSQTLSVDCALQTGASGTGAPMAVCTEFAAAPSATVSGIVFTQAAAKVEVQMKTNGAGSIRMGITGVAVSVLTVLGGAGLDQRTRLSAERGPRHDLDHATTVATADSSVILFSSWVENYVSVTKNRACSAPEIMASD
ncbi:hypothetical protein BD310DRAFT_834282 [Dichomitus squalens]|uniref:Uncharacterized protein n=1 Tax=Dichomitus squalens TaxID=114155 RepID=A0A4Q9PDZ8_9APHY|nr:hypothetical protein BD310DRAFT_834282 [Dichomitus squalens]